MDRSELFKEKMRRGEVCLGTAISFSDPTVTEALCTVLDFVWIDTEHNPLSLADVQGHIMATKGTDVLPLVRVPWNDPVLIKPILDIGAAGVIVPMIRTADDVRLAVSACRYPPEGIRGYGPRRPSNYARLGGPEFCKAENDKIITVVQIEHIDAVNNIDEILAVPGLMGLLVGANDLSGSMGLMGQPRHPDVLNAIDTVIAKSRKAGVFIGIGIGDDPDILREWVDRGMQWISMGNDYSLMLRAADQVSGLVRAHAKQKTASSV
ncbi:MAG: hypothetical protein IT324_17440 [Anaerolineae bacterium]|nr:hypothetical protein [Anaerolineae bacterium]